MAVKLRIVGLQKSAADGRITWRYRAQAYDGMTVVWTCEHEHPTPLLAQECANDWMSGDGPGRWGGLPPSG